MASRAWPTSSAARSTATRSPCSGRTSSRTSALRRACSPSCRSRGGPTTPRPWPPTLAVHLASAGKATFLVDASLREPHLSRLGIGATLEEVANAPERLADVGRVDSVGPLRVLAAERPLAPLDSMQVADRLPGLVRRLAELADHVIIASSPVVGQPRVAPDPVLGRRRGDRRRGAAPADRPGEARRGGVARASRAARG
jgi:hypothetical protein